MECKYCGAPLKAGDRICGACGRVVPDWTPETEPAEEQAVLEAAEETEETAAAEEEAPVKKKYTGLIVAIAACVVIILGLVAVLLSGKNEAPAELGTPAQDTAAGTPAEDKLEVDEGAVAGETGTTEQTPYVPAVSYTFDDPAVFDEVLLAEVIATCGESTLTNDQLAYYYWREVYTFFNSYAEYLMFLMDPYARLDQQESIIQGRSWDEMFMDAALESFHTYAAACEKARAEGYTLTESEQEGLENMDGELQSYADLYGYETIDEYVQSNFGPYTGAETYKQFRETYLFGGSYLDSLLNAREYTEEDLLAFYEEHKDDFEAAGLVYDDTRMVNIRHILIKPEAIEIAEGEEGYEAALQAALDAAKTEAQAIYDEWLTNPTEDNFALLAQEHSDDGSAAYGGLIEQIYPGQTVENFDAWCFEEGRKEGDHGLVETEFGYHIIFLSGFCEDSHWSMIMSAEYENELYSTICEELRAEYPMETDLTKAAVYPINVDTAAQPAQ